MATTGEDPTGSQATANNQQSTTINVPRSGLPPFPPFDPHSDRTTLSTKWRKWQRRFENLMISLRENDPTVKRALLLTYVGEQTNDIFDTLPNTGTDYDTAILRLTEHFSPTENKDMAIFDFRQVKQQSGESIDEFYRRLKEKACLCGFHDEDNEIKTQVIHKTSDPRLRRKALREQLDLKNILTYGKTLEKSDLSARKLEQVEKHETATSETTNHIEFNKRQYGQSGNQHNQRPRQNKGARHPQNNTKPQQPSKQLCRNCGGTYPHQNGKYNCPAHGKECHNCRKIGHFAKYCLSKTLSKPPRQKTDVNKKYADNITSEAPPSSDTDDEFTFNLYDKQKQPQVTVSIAKIPIRVIIDSGSTVNIINENTFNVIKRSNRNVNLEKSNAKIYPYGAEKPLQVLGQFTATVVHDSTSTTATFQVTKSSTKCLLSCNTSTVLGLLKTFVNNVNVQHPNPDVQRIINKHKSLFQGIGKLKGTEVKLEIDENITPVVQRARRIPHSMKSKVNAKLKEMLEQDIIEKAEGATPWLTPLIAIPKKSGDVRLVLDMRVPNQALKRRRVQMPTVDEILQKMQGATVFTEVDLSQGYLQISLAPESRYITAFPTPEDGPHRFKRLIMGACPSGEYFHEEIHNIIRNIPNCANISDNIWLWSDNMTTHLKDLDHLLTTLEKSGITLRQQKCSFAVPRINVFGHIVSSNGIQPDEAKISAITTAPRPKCAAEVRSFLGLTNYCSRYIDNYSSITYPLRQLTKANAKFHWTDQHQAAFDKLKTSLSNSPVLAHFNLSSPTRLVTDASPWAVGAILLQQQPDMSYRPVAYGSRSLTVTEMKYAQIEREALAIVYGCEHFHTYLYGKTFELETDHRPLEHLFQPKVRPAGKPPPARIERWILRLQEYDFTVIYRPGAKNLADPLSRLPLPTTARSSMESCAERYICNLVQQMTPCAMETEEIRQASLADQEIKQANHALATNQLHSLPKAFQSISDELSTTNDILLRGNRIVLPKSLQTKAVLLAHEDHAGITRTKQRLRSKLWWPKMDAFVEEHINKCHACQVTGNPSRPEPVQPTELPNERWSSLAIDVCGPFPTGEYVVTLIDYYSRWPEAKIMKSITSSNILAWLDEVFATHGYPKQIKSDNASYFKSNEFYTTLKSWGVTVKYVTEYWPQANGLVERFNKVLLKHVQTSLVEGKDWRKTLPTLLRNYRTTPHRTTGETPSHLLMHRELRTKIPSQVTDIPLFNDLDTRRADEQSKQKGKEYADTRRHAKPKDIQPGDYVLVQQKHQNKFSTTFHKDPIKVIKVNGSQIVVKDNDGQTHRRNSAHVKKVPHEGILISIDEEIDNDTVTENQEIDLAPEPPNQPIHPPEAIEEIPPPVPQRRSTRTHKAPEYYQSGYT